MEPISTNSNTSKKFHAVGITSLGAVAAGFGAMSHYDYMKGEVEEVTQHFTKAARNYKEGNIPSKEKVGELREKLQDLDAIVDSETLQGMTQQLANNENYTAIVGVRDDLAPIRDQYGHSAGYGGFIALAGAFFATIYVLSMGARFIKRKLA